MTRFPPRPDRGVRLTAAEHVARIYARYPKTMELLRQSELDEGKSKI